MYLAALALGAALAFSPPGCGLDRAPPVAKARRQQLLRMGEPGTEVDPETIGWEERQWKKRKDTPVTDDGACFVISEEEAPEYAARGQPCRGTASDSQSPDEHHPFNALPFLSSPMCAARQSSGSSAPTLPTTRPSSASWWARDQEYTPYDQPKCACWHAHKPRPSFHEARHGVVSVRMLTQVPEWMGEAPDGGHAVWLCSASKPE